MPSIAHISDTHFGTEVPEVVSAIQQAMQAIKPDIAILSGDITQRARSSQFKAASDFMAALPAKTQFVFPGNHDIPLFNLFARFLTPYRNYTDIFGSREQVWSDGKLGIVCLDATSPWRHTDGKLAPQKLIHQIKAVRKQLKQDGILMVCAHQPLYTAWPQDASETLIHRNETARLCSENGVDVMLSGHVHVPLVTSTQNAFPDIPRHFILCGAGTAVSRRVRPGAPNSFNVINIHEDGIEIARYDFDKVLSQFVSLPTASFAPAARGWSSRSGEGMG